MTDNVATVSAAVAAMQPDWALAAALLGGTRAMRDARVKYLPMWPSEDLITYDCRVRTAVLFPAYKRTIETLTGKPFSRPITFGDDVPPAIVTLMEDADLRGRNLQVFAAELLEWALAKGLAGLLVEYPIADGVQTLADERDKGLRPYFIAIKPEQILGWRSEVIAGEETLTQLRLMECVEEPDGQFGTKSVDQVRVLTRGGWQTYRKKKNANGDDEWALFAEGLTTLDEIPFVPIYGDQVGFMVGKAPLIELAHMNVEHWQSASDQQTILHTARVPLLVLIGQRSNTSEGADMAIGSGTMGELSIGSDMKYVEHSGKAIEAGQASLKDLEERMRQAGAELMILNPQRITAFQVATENDVSMCALARVVQALEDALDQALQFMAEWLKLPEGGHVTLFKDFAASAQAEASAQYLLDGAKSNVFSKETVFEEFKRRNILGPDTNWEDEQARMDSQGPPLGTLGGGGAAFGQPAPGGNAPPQ